MNKKRKKGSSTTKVVAEEATSEKLQKKVYEKKLLQLQAELCTLQEWVKATGQRIIIIFEGRDAAGKGGCIKAITERVSPRVFKVVALPAPTERGGKPRCISNATSPIFPQQER